MKILALETSCDETAAAVVEDGVKILGHSVASSAAMHEKYGGIVPEVAAREQLKCIIPTIQDALEQYTGNTIPLFTHISENIDALAITVGPGLIGSLLIGVETAKTIALVTGKPIIPVNHVLAHMYANFLSSPKGNLSRVPVSDAAVKIEFPAISLVVSGGHTELFLLTSPKDMRWLGGTLDDAAGEAFDKTARLLGFGSRGGLAIQEAASQWKHMHADGKRDVSKLPRPMLDKDNYLNFSFSGLKTAILREVNRLKENRQLDIETIQHLTFEVQETITDVLVAKTLRAVGQYHTKSVLLSGGVAANLRLREKFMTSLSSCHISPDKFFVPPVSLCTDNAAYIASYAFFRGEPSDWHNITAIPDFSVEV